uniref:Uncharacterized protein n=1 Tax=Romanomermis culicivorax TaxID=13658 RepID=A0A915L0W8_ROMCU
MLGEVFNIVEKSKRWFDLIIKHDGPPFLTHFQRVKPNSEEKNRRIFVTENWRQPATIDKCRRFFESNRRNSATVGDSKE